MSLTSISGIFRGGEGDSRLIRLLKAIGPGIVLAGAAIGVSHIVQSTQAGAIYGFALVWAVILANVAKYPAFEFPFRYAAATRKTMLEGFQALGNWVLVIVLAITVFTGAITMMVVNLVTASLASTVLPVGIPPAVWLWVVIFLCFAVIAIGRYPLLDKTVKVIVFILGVCTVIAFFAALSKGSNIEPDFVAPELLTASGVFFILALMGWMPAPIDVGFWTSLWSEERRKQTGYTPLFSEMRVDFHIGYFSSAIMALMFLGLGAFVMYGTGAEFARGAGGFANQVIHLYTESLGDWAFPVVGAAALTCMFSTTLTCLDGYQRVSHRAICLLTGHDHTRLRRDPLYWGCGLFFVAASILGGTLFVDNLVQLAAFAMVVSFLSQPFMALFHHGVVTRTNIREQYRIPTWLRIYSLFGIAFLFGFALIFLLVHFGGVLG